MEKMGPQTQSSLHHRTFKPSDSNLHRPAARPRNRSARRRSIVPRLAPQPAIKPAGAARGAESRRNTLSSYGISGWKTRVFTGPFGAQKPAVLRVYRIFENRAISVISERTRRFY